MWFSLPCRHQNSQENQGKKVAYETLTLSRRRSLSDRNQAIDFLCKFALIYTGFYMIGASFIKELIRNIQLMHTQYKFQVSPITVDVLGYVAKFLT